MQSTDPSIRGTFVDLKLTFADPYQQVTQPTQPVVMIKALCAKSFSCANSLKDYNYILTTKHSTALPACDVVPTTCPNEIVGSSKLVPSVNEDGLVVLTKNEDKSFAITGQSYNL